MIDVPVLIGFDQTKCIGTLHIDETKLPIMADYVFAISYRVDQAGPKHQFDTIKELVAVSLQSDEEYFAYLKSNNVGPCSNGYDAGLQNHAMGVRISQDLP